MVEAELKVVPYGKGDILSLHKNLVLFFEGLNRHAYGLRRMDNP